jgi:hypothetical protein
MRATVVRANVGVRKCRPCKCQRARVVRAYVRAQMSVHEYVYKLRDNPFEPETTTGYVLYTEAKDLYLCLN